MTVESQCVLRANGAFASSVFRSLFRHSATPPLMQNGQAYESRPTHTMLYSDLAVQCDGADDRLLCPIVDNTPIYVVRVAYYSCFQRAQRTKG